MVMPRRVCGSCAIWATSGPGCAALSICCIGPATPRMIWRKESATPPSFAIIHCIAWAVNAPGTRMDESHLGDNEGVEGHEKEASTRKAQLARGVGAACYNALEMGNACGAKQ